MKKSLIIKIISLCLCFLTLLSCATLFASAEDTGDTSINWTVSDNAEYLYGNDKRYDRYYVNGAFYGDARKAYYFKNYVSIDGKRYEVYGDSEDPHIVTVEDGYRLYYVFTDTEGRKILDDFLNGNDVVYYLEEANYKYTVIDNTLAEQLDTAYNNSDNSSTTRTVAVNTLADVQKYELTAHDKLEMKAYKNGAIYCMPDGTMYYICFENLDNNYFDADGNFSYRKGNVKVLVVDSNLKKNINKSLRSLEIKRNAKVFERLQPLNDDEKTAKKKSPIPFWIFYSFFGFILPLPFLILGLVLPRSKKFSTPKMWYSLAISAGVWILAALALFILIII